MKIADDKKSAQFKTAPQGISMPETEGKTMMPPDFSVTANPLQSAESAGPVQAKMPAQPNAEPVQMAVDKSTSTLIGAGIGGVIGGVAGGLLGGGVGAVAGAAGGAVVGGLIGNLVGGGEKAEKESDNEIETKFKKLAADGKHSEAILYFFKAYGFETLKFDIKIVPPYDAWASVGGEIKEGAKQTLTVGNDLFDQPFEFIARTLGHEWQHIKQRSQKDPLTNQDEREYLAYCFELLDTSVPAHTDVSEIKQSIKMALKHYGNMPEDLQKKHADTKKKIDELKKKYP
jgi:hypothetical protein